MTEKRFKEIVSTQKVIDNRTGREYDCLLDNDLLDLINHIAEENKRLKHDATVLICLNQEYRKENEQLKQQSTMYHNLFIELQKQLKNVKRASDLDSKDFYDLIELSKGNVFDEELRWIHLPIKELEE